MRVDASSLRVDVACRQLGAGHECHTCTLRIELQYRATQALAALAALDGPKDAQGAPTWRPDVWGGMVPLKRRKGTCQRTWTSEHLTSEENPGAQSKEKYGSA